MSEVLVYILAGLGAFVLSAMLLFLIAASLDWLRLLIIGWRHAASNAPANYAWQQVDQLRAEIDDHRRVRGNLSAAVKAAEKERDAIAKAIRDAWDSATGEPDPTATPEDLARRLGDYGVDWRGLAQQAESERDAGHHTDA